jgi:alkylated DNA repair dioxygenase AlkB
MMVGVDEPLTYEPNFLTPEEAAEFVDDCEHKLKFTRHMTAWGHRKRHAVISFTLTHSPQMYMTEDLRPFEQAPKSLKRLRTKLSAHSGRDVNYFSVVRYVDGDDYMGWHNHKEDKGYDGTVWIVSVGAARTFAIRDIATQQVTKVRAEAGSLITLSSEANDTHQHMVPKVKGYSSVRYAVNCKATGMLTPSHVIPVLNRAADTQLEMHLSYD